MAAHTEKKSFKKGNGGARGNKDSGFAPESKSHKRDRVSWSLSTTLQDAIAALRNNAAPDDMVLVAKEEKLPAGYARAQPVEVYPAALVKAMRGLFSQGKTYEFVLHTAFSPVASAGGALLGISPISPAVSSYVEWSALAALFDEVKYVMSRCEWTAGNAPVIGTASLIMAFDEQNLATDPASFNTVFRYPNAVGMQYPLFDHGSGVHKRVHKAAAARPYCNTATPAIQSPPSGMAGSWSFANGTLLTSAGSYGTFYMYVVAKFRCRA